MRAYKSEREIGKTKREREREESYGIIAIRKGCTQDSFERFEPRAP